MGPTNKIIDDLIEAHTDIKSVVGYDHDDELTNWDLPTILSDLHIVKESYQGTTYQGNQCREILKLINKLWIPLVLKPCESALYALDDLVTPI